MIAALGILTGVHVVISLIDHRGAGGRAWNGASKAARHMESAFPSDERCYRRDGVHVSSSQTHARAHSGNFVARHAGNCVLRAV